MLDLANDRHLRVAKYFETFIAFVFIPLFSILNLLSIRVIYIILSNRRSTKYLFTFLTIHSTIALSTNYLSYFFMKYKAASNLCHIFVFLNNSFMFTASLFVITIVFDRFVQLKCKRIKFLYEKRNYILLLLIFVLISTILNIPSLTMANKKFNETMNQSIYGTFYMDCSAYNRNSLFILDFIDLILNNLFEFLIVLLLNVLISKRILKTKQNKSVQHKRITYKSSTSSSRTSFSSMFKKENNFMNHLFIINAFGFLFQMPFVLVKFFKHFYRISSSYALTDSNDTYTYSQNSLIYNFIYLESLAFFLRIVHYTFPFLANFLLNGYFRKNYLQILVYKD
jgi:hypothetical protein